MYLKRQQNINVGMCAQGLQLSLILHTQSHDAACLITTDDNNCAHVHSDAVISNPCQCTQMSTLTLLYLIHVSVLGVFFNPFFLSIHHNSIKLFIDHCCVFFNIAICCNTCRVFSFTCIAIDYRPIKLKSFFKIAVHIHTYHLQECQVVGPLLQIVNLSCCKLHAQIQH